MWTSAFFWEKPQALLCCCLYKCTATQNSGQNFRVCLSIFIDKSVGTPLIYFCLRQIHNQEFDQEYLAKYKNVQKVYHFKSDPKVLNIYYVLNRILFREEENLNRLISSEIKRMAGNCLISPRIQILGSPFSSQLWVILELNRGKISRIEGV